jgi:hypothetical protein
VIVKVEVYTPVIELREFQGRNKALIKQVRGFNLTLIYTLSPSHFLPSFDPFSFVSLPSLSFDQSCQDNPNELITLSRSLPEGGHW